MKTRNQNHSWGNNTIPASLLSVMLGVPGACAAENREHSKGYLVESANRVLLLGASTARRARRWPTRRRSPILPAENIAAIKLLDSWLSMPEIKDNDFGEGIRQRIDENRLSDRKFFT